MTDFLFLPLDSQRVSLFSGRFVKYMTKYSKKSQQKVKKAMHEMHKGELESGKSHEKVTSRKQAIAIGLSEARKEGARLPNKQ